MGKVEAVKITIELLLTSSGKQNPRKRRRDNPWTTGEIALLGRMPDSTLASRIGRSIREVVAQRETRRIGIPGAPRRWTITETKLLGEFSDAELARRFGRKLGQVRTQRLALKIPPFKPRPKFRFWTPKKSASWEPCRIPHSHVSLGAACNRCNPNEFFFGFRTFVPNSNRGPELRSDCWARGVTKT